ncbi:MAG: UDP-2,3-diacylglucosamine diphosphatase [Nitratireductor sp.]|nr:UDP-2,3-diacylglucosamine diphosphatase [Nitratireductor sp.]MCC0019815.1 UDP-2,3-diacylglucosamine diphosphatase [Nitratireductor sp.]
MGRYRTIFMSDMHLGSTGCQAQQILTFLKYNEAETFYLVGDIIDGWRLRKSWYWPQLHNDVVQKLLRQVRKGATIRYLPGNHDEFLRSFAGNSFGGIHVEDTFIHETADGKRLLVIHGDQFDVVVRHAKWLAFLGDWAYNVALFTNTWLNRVRRRMGFPYWSLSSWLKLKVKNAVSFIGKYEAALADAASDDQLDGVICGHIHHAEMGERGGVEYVNTGDWVESCTAVVEHFDGRLELIDWSPIHAEIVRREGVSDPAGADVPVTIPPELIAAASRQSARNSVGKVA